MQSKADRATSTAIAASTAEAKNQTKESGDIGGRTNIISQAV
jgi:hypothetical protein